MEFSAGKPNSNPMNEQDSQILTAILSKVFITENPNSYYSNSSAVTKKTKSNNIPTISFNSDQNSAKVNVSIQNTQDILGCKQKVCAIKTNNNYQK